MLDVQMARSGKVQAQDALALTQLMGALSPKQNLTREQRRANSGSMPYRRSSMKRKHFNEFAQ